ncbi:MAG: hypothetical protein HWN80_19185 [Candidatus Lokiarchaeota archaeon]|nr:hypothetical protein [Candidatus Lokiarchaeota archaeon]
MVEDSSGYHRCRFCNSIFSDDILKRIENQKDDVYCESCGDIIKRVQNKYSINPPDIAENEPKTNINKTPETPQEELKPNPDVLNFPIGRVFYDKDFPLVFKSNFVIVFSRQVCFAALRLEHEGEIELGHSEIPENTMNDLYMSTRHIQDRQINADFLTNLRKISKEEFKNNLKKLQTKIQSNRQYLEDFHVYTRWLIRKVYLIISDEVSKNELSKIDLTIFRDLKEFFEGELDNLTIEYNTINLLDDLNVEVGHLVPKSEKPKGKLSNEKLSVYLGFEERYVRVLKTRIRAKSHKAYNPDFTFSEDQLAQMIQNLEISFGEKKIQNCIKKIEKYKTSNFILEYRHQQWQIHNPNLNINFFQRLDTTDKGYYFGLLLADGMTEKDVSIGLFLAKKDLNVIYRFRKALGIENKIEQKVSKTKKNSGEPSIQYGVRVGCKPMLDDLKTLHFYDFKEGKPLPNDFFLKLDRKVALSILCGFYDGDGEQGTTYIHNTNKYFLEQIKREFKIQNSVRLSKKGGKNIKYRSRGRDYVGDLKDSWYLALGSEIFNEMMESVSESMERKRKFYPLSIDKYAYKNLKELIKNKLNLETLIRIAPITTLIKKFGVSFETFHKLCQEWNVESLPHSYWKRIENKNWKDNFEDKFQIFKEKYLRVEM